MPEDPDVQPPPPPRPSGLDRFSPLLAELGLDPRRLMFGGVAVVALLGVAIAALWPRGAAGPPPEDSLPVASSMVSMPSPTTAPTEIVVHVAGQVAQPGVYDLPATARVDDAITGAGGLAPGADAARVNLAAPLTDGERVYVPAVGEVVPAVAVGESPGGPGPDGAPLGVVNLNTADEAELETLPGVGPATAQAIIDHREQNGPFASVDQLLDVRGIGDAKLADLRDLVTL